MINQTTQSIINPIYYRRDKWPNKLQIPQVTSRTKLIETVELIVISCFYEIVLLIRHKLTHYSKLL